jgi:hypothetical protein
MTVFHTVDEQAGSTAPKCRTSLGQWRAFRLLLHELRSNREQRAV